METSNQLLRTQQNTAIINKHEVTFSLQKFPDLPPPLLSICTTAAYEAVSNETENYHVHDRPRRTGVVDSRQLIPFTFSVQTGQMTSPVSMIILTIVGYEGAFTPG